jgi:stage II sporulation protein D
MRWRFSVGRAELCGSLGQAECQLETAEVGRGGWVKRIVVRGSKDREMSGENFHLLMGRKFGWGKFKSARFKLESSKDRFTFRGRGMGHGVGMCQHGAMGMERAGKDYEAILRHYFPGTEVSRWP